MILQGCYKKNVSQQTWLNESVIISLLMSLQTETR